MMRQPLDIPVVRDSDGFLMDPEDWSEDIAHQLAAEWGLTLTEDHLAVLRFMRDWHEEHQIVPDVRDVVPFISQRKGLSKKDAKAYLFRLFPHGYMQQACQIAGFRRPRAWSVG